MSKDLKGGSPGKLQDTVLLFTWGNWERSRNTSVRVTPEPAEIWTRCLWKI